MKLYHTETQVDYDALMIELEEKGYKWLSGNKPTYFRYWKQEKENSCIKISDKYITFGSIEWHKKEYPDTPIIEYKAKGENMLNTECKQCHKKWHHDNAKYCEMCGRKLIYEPEFKSGDIVASETFDDDGFGLVRLNEDLINRLTLVNGLWYTKDDCDITEVSLGVFKEDTRHATPEEILEYESALNFHKHGRKPFEVKKDDILLEVGDSKLFVNVPEICSKKDFVTGGYTLFKTAEEVNEWLGAADETK